MAANAGRVRPVRKTLGAIIQRDALDASTSGWIAGEVETVPTATPESFDELATAGIAGVGITFVGIAIVDVCPAALTADAVAADQSVATIAVFIALAGAFDAGEIIRADIAAGATVVDGVERLATVSAAGGTRGTAIAASEAVVGRSKEETVTTAAGGAWFGVVTRCTKTAGLRSDVAEPDLTGGIVIGALVVGTALPCFDADTAATALTVAIAADTATHQFERTAAFLTDTDRPVCTAFAIAALLSSRTAFETAGVTVTDGTTAGDVGRAWCRASAAAPGLERVTGVATASRIGTRGLTGTNRCRGRPRTGGTPGVDVGTDD